MGPRQPAAAPSTAAAAAGRVGVLRALGVFGLFVLVGSLTTAPLLLHAREGLPYTHAPEPGEEVVERAAGDYLQFYYHLWLLQDGLFGPTPLFRDPYEFSWGGPQPGIRTYFLPLSLLYLLLLPLGSYAAYNGLVLLSFGLAGLAMYLLARELTGPGWPALLAGGVFALAPYRHAVLLGGHPAGVAFFLLPLALLGADRALRTGRAGWGGLAGAAVLSLAFVEPHFLYFAALLLPPYLLARAWPRWPAPVPGAPGALRGAVVRRIPILALLAAAPVAALAGRGLDWGSWAAAWLALLGALGAAWALSTLCLARLRDEPGAASAGPALACLLPLALPALSPLRLRWDTPGLTPRLVTTALGLTLATHLAVLARHPRGRARLAAAARALRPLWPLGLALGVAVGVLLYLKATVVDPSGAGGGRTLREIGLFSPRPADWLARFQAAATRSIYPGAVAVGLAAFGLARRAGSAALRPTLAVLTALFLGAEVLSLGPHGGPLYRWLYEVVPYFGLIRQTSKFQVLAFLALALLAATGAHAVRDGLGRRPAGRVAAALALLLVAADYWPARPVGVSRLPAANGVYAALRAGEPGRVLYLPVWPGDSAWSSLYEFATTLTRRPMVNGYSAIVSRRYVEEVYRPLDHLNRGEVTEEVHGRLRALDVRYLVFDRGAFPPQVSPFNAGFTFARLWASPYLDLLREEPPFSLFRVRETPRAEPADLPSTPYGFFFEAERLPRRVGEVVEDPTASWGRAVEARDEAARAPEFLVFYARAGLPRGTFRVVFRLRGAGPAAAEAARIEAVTDGGRRLLAARAVSGGELSARWEDRALTLVLARPEWVEFRVRWEGRGTLAVDYIYGHFADHPDPPRVFQHNEFGYGSGPFRRFPAGEYLLRVRVRVEARVDAPVLRVTVATAHERAPLAARVVRGRELAAPGVYEDLDLPFRLDALRVLEFLIDFLREGVAVDRLEVIPRT